jgi:DNA polymerase-3 subunit delta'
MQFKDIIGHEGLKKRLINSVKNNRISHAQLFYGAEGTHKLALATAYAQYILCTDKKADDSCGVCHSCQKINKLQHPDIHFFYPLPGKDIPDTSENWRKLLTQNDGHVSLEAWGKILEAENKQFTIYTEQTLGIIREVGMKPFEAEYKVIIIWLIEKLYHGAVSKILKSLEEPNDKTVFLLVTENYEDVVTTIISRTQLVKVNKYSDDEIRNALIDKYHANTHRASDIARIADGNFTYALSLFKQGVDNDELTLFIELTRNAFAYARTGKKFKEVSMSVDQVAKLGREKIKEFLKFSLLMFQQSLYLNKNASEIARITNDENDFLSKFNQFVTINNIGSLYEETNKAIFHIERNGNAQIVLTDYAIQIGFALKKK